MSKPTILLINRLYPPERGATGRMMQDLAQALEKSGWHVSVLAMAPQSSSFTKGYISTDIIKEAKKPKTALGCLTNLWRLYRAGKKLEAHDVVLTMTDPPLLAVVGAKIAKSKKSRHIHWAQDLYPDLFEPLGIKLPAWFYRILRKQNIKALNQADQVVVIGRCMGQYLKTHGVLVNKISYIPNWTDFEVISPTARTHVLSLKTLPQGVAKRPEEMFRDDSPKFRVLYAGNVGRAHTMRAVLDAAELLSENTEIEFVFVGDHDSHSMLARERSKRGLQNIKFIPYQPLEKLRDVMESGDLHLVTMRRSVKGMIVPCKFYSGLTVGRPTLYVGPEGTEIAQVIAEYGAGVCFNPQDAKGLADAIYAYRMDGEKWFQTQEGALRAAQNYHPNFSLKKWIELLNNLRVS